MLYVQWIAASQRQGAQTDQAVNFFSLTACLEEIKICVIGAGNWGRNHVKTLLPLNVTIGCIDTDSNQLQKIKSLFPKIICYSNFEESIKDNFDGYVIATPPSSHFKLSKKIIENYKPLLVEKPLTLDLKSAIELNRIAKENKVNLMVGHVLLFHPAFIKMKNLCI